MKIVTKTGDMGETSLIGGQRVKKYDLRVKAYGEIDELQAHLGMCIAQNLSGELSAELKDIQKTLFSLSADLADGRKEKKFYTLPEDLERLEKFLAPRLERLPELKSFVTPGASVVGSLFHVARTVCRRAERSAVEVGDLHPENFNPLLIIYLNRLADYLFCLAFDADHSK
ncbi:cob(I)yrinic acid a,c-diamide adenosyltransferase [bacterium]|nr:cob(I)yrinic acid a,c-diamide adenosyltransferase [bacterium]